MSESCQQSKEDGIKIKDSFRHKKKLYRIFFHLLCIDEKRNPWFNPPEKYNNNNNIQQKKEA